MTHPLLMSCGSRGDVEPMFALALALAERSDVERVTLVVPSDQTQTAPKVDNVRLITFEFSLADVWKYFPTFSGEADVGVFDARAELLVFGKLVVAKILPLADFLLSVVRESSPTVLVTGSMTMSLCYTAAELHKLPLAWVQFQPIMPSSYYPQLMLHKSQCAEAMDALLRGKNTYDEKHWESHVEQVRIFFPAFCDQLNEMRARVGKSLRKLTVKDLVDCSAGRASDVHLLINTSRALVPRTPDMSSTAHSVGSMAAEYIPPGWAAEDELSLFLAAGPKPAVVSFGSMDPQGAGAQLTAAVLTGLRAAGVERIVLLPGFAELGRQGVPEEMQNCTYVAQRGVQLSWILPQCKLFVSHCGAGSVGAAVVSGVPIVAVPVISDQFFFAELIERRRLGARIETVGLPNVTSKSIEEAARLALMPHVRQACGKCRDESKFSGEGATLAARLVVEIHADHQKMTNE